MSVCRPLEVMRVGTAERYTKFRRVDNKSVMG